MRDYKGRVVSAGARWAQDRRLQVALYALAARELLGLEPAGALYQPVGNRDVRPRGIVRDDVPGRYVNGDVVDADAFEAALEEARAVAAARRPTCGRAGSARARTRARRSAAARTRRSAAPARARLTEAAA